MARFNYKSISFSENCVVVLKSSQIALQSWILSDITKLMKIQQQSIPQEFVEKNQCHSLASALASSHTKILYQSSYNINMATRIPSFIWTVAVFVCMCVLVICTNNSKQTIPLPHLQEGRLCVFRLTS